MTQISVLYLGKYLDKMSLSFEDTFASLKSRIVDLYPDFASISLTFSYLENQIVDEEKYVCDFIRGKNQALTLEPEIEDTIEKKLLPNGQYGAFAKKKIPKDTIVLIVNPSKLLPEASMHSVQYNEVSHISPENLKLGRYLNHSCEPNLRILFVSKEYIDNEGLKKQKYKLYFLANRNIIEGEQFTFNYLTTEYDMAEAFDCECFTSKCFKKIGGYKNLCDEDKKRIREYSIAPHLIKMDEKSMK